MRHAGPGPADSFHLGQPEIQNLYLSASGNKNICGLDVSVHDPLRVRRFQRVRNLNRHSQQFFDLKRLPSHLLRERLPFQQFHHDEVLPLVLFDRVNRANVGMIQRGRCPRFALKAFQQLRVLRHFGRQEFQRHAASEPRILRFVDDAHPATTQLARDFVMRNALTEQSVHR